MVYFFQIAIDTLVLASVYTLIGTGFALRYSIAKYLDLGYGAHIAIGAYAYFLFSEYFGVVAILPAVIFSVTVAYASERFYFAKLEDKKSSPMVMMIASLGFMTLVQAIIAIFFTSSVQVLHTDASVIKIYDVVVTYIKIITIAVAFSAVILLNLVFTKTKFGKHLIAVSDNKDLAQTSGIPIKKLSIISASIAAGVAALSGILYGMDTIITPFIGLSLLLSGITAAILVNIQDPKKVYIGALILAVIQSLVIWFIGGMWKDAAVFLLLIVILLLRPEGLLRRRGIRQV